MTVSTLTTPHMQLISKIFEIEKWEVILPGSVIAVLEDLLLELRPRSERLVRSLFGFGVAPKTQADFAIEFGLTRNRVGDLLKGVLVHLRHPVQRDRLVLALAEAGVNFSGMEELLDEATTPVEVRSITYLEVGTRSHSALHSGGIELIKDLLEKSETELLRVPNFGRKNFQYLKEELLRHGLRLPD